MKKIRGALFDLDGVITDSEPWHALARSRVFARLGIPKKTEKTIVLGARKSDYWSELKTSFSLNETTDGLINAEFDAILALMKENNVRECANLKPLLETLRARGITAAVASSSFRGYVTGVLDYLGIAEYFSAIVCGDEISRPKPFPDAYLTAAEKIGVPPDECFAVEDSKTGTLAAKKAGIFCFGYRGTETAKKTDFSACDLIVDDFNEIEKIIDKFSQI